MILRTGTRRGFSLIEVMIAIVVLFLGFVFIYETFFVFLDLFNYYADYLDVGILIESKLWEIKDIFMHTEEPEGLDNKGVFLINNKEFKWSLDYNLVDEESGLYRIDFSVLAKPAKRERRFLRTTYVSYRKDEESVE
ncbi:MAG: prepilin-type N-terminal cleavage/methylation domain-containing protein [Candidatus Omnitrophica bacterium]|nr:prepilin-type N-terminal cleavage/methylation domain-containing protein [Candidatus Omnitrophota bacterium]